MLCAVAGEEKEKQGPICKRNGKKELIKKTYHDGVPRKQNTPSKVVWDYHELKINKYNCLEIHFGICGPKWHVKDR